MKYLKPYNQLYEGLRDKMTSISDKEVSDKLSKLSPLYKIFNGIKFLKLDVIKEGFDEINTDDIKERDIVTIFNNLYEVLDDEKSVEIVEYLVTLDILKKQKTLWNSVMDVCADKNYNNSEVIKILINNNLFTKRGLNGVLFSAIYYRNYDVIGKILKSKSSNPFEIDGQYLNSVFNFFLDGKKKLGDLKILQLFLDHPKIDKYYSDEEIEELKKWYKQF